MTESKSKPQPFPKIHKNECKSCNRCIISCENNVLEISENLNDSGYNYAKYKGEGCNGCGNCYYTCPEPLAIEIHIPLKKSVKKEMNENKTKKED